MNDSKESSAPLPVLSHFQARALLDARQAALTVTRASLDLGLSLTDVALSDAGVHFPDGRGAKWTEIEAIAEDEEHCFAFEGETLKPIRRYSELMQQTYSLMPTRDAPALIISGFTMHRFKDITPMAAARAMVSALGPLRGRVLDTGTGLGYTALSAARTAREVVTIELDERCQELAGLNPWSRGLFDDTKIQQVLGDSSHEVGKFEKGSFQAIIHDPPSMSRAGDLYSGAFYQQLFDVLAPRGKLFHYIGDPDSAFGSGVTRGVVRRLHAVGFRKVTAAREAFGVVALK